MRQALRENALCAFAAISGCATIAWLGLYGFAWNDYEMEAQPSFTALAHGHFVEFLRLAPAYGGSLIMRAPFALAPNLWGGGELAVYRMIALPCLLAAVVLAVWLCARMRAAGHSTLARAVAVGVCAANPIALFALEYGHAEEILGACLCVAAVLIAGRSSLGRQRTVWAGALLGLALANKPWALLAVGPVLLALVSSTGAWRWRPAILCMGTAGAVTALVLAPLTIVSRGGIAHQTLATPAQEIFQPWEVWWFLGTPNHVPAPHGETRSVPLNAPLSTRPQWRIAPSWLRGITHPLIVLLAIPLTLLAWRSRRTKGAALQLLALLLLLRCVLDTWDISLLPAAVPARAARLGGQRARTSRPPVFALASTALAWLSFEVAALARRARLPVSVLPRVVAAARLLAGAARARLAADGRSNRFGSADTVSAFGRPVRPRPSTHDHQVLDPHAQLARADRRPARPSRRCPPRSGSSEAVRDSRGASWTSRPTPWPSPWPKCSPYAACSISLARHRVDVAPAEARGAPRRGPPPARPARARRPPAPALEIPSPVAYVRVQSEQ